VAFELENDVDEVLGDHDFLDGLVVDLSVVRLLNSMNLVLVDDNLGGHDPFDGLVVGLSVNLALVYVIVDRFEQMVGFVDSLSQA
jgi:hypothetical protein